MKIIKKMMENKLKKTLDMNAKFGYTIQKVKKLKSICNYIL